jgi:restriction system protein
MSLLETRETGSNVQFYVESDFITTVEHDPPWHRSPKKNHEFLSSMLSPLYKGQGCHFCKRQLTKEQAKDGSYTHAFSLIADKLGITRLQSLDTDIFRCQHCGWWAVHQDIMGRYISETENYTSLVFASGVHWSKIREFEISSVDIPIQHLRDYLRQHPDKLYDISPRAFELLLTDCLRDFFDCEAIHVGGPGDKGIDIILVVSDNPILVQVKRREKPDSVESVRVVREVLGTLLLESQYHGMIISTAKRFSREAVRAATLPVITSKGFKVTLYDYQTVLNIISAGRKTTYAPWGDLWTP